MKTIGICKGLRYGCESSDMNEFDENDNVIPYPLTNGLCDGCVEVQRDNQEFDNANRGNFDNYQNIFQE